jgi:periplasmic protein TonB
MAMNIRDIKQRAFGCIGFSAIGHSLLLLTLIFMAPKKWVETDASAGTKKSALANAGEVELAQAGPATTPATAAQTSLPTSGSTSIPTSEVTQAPPTTAQAIAPVARTQEVAPQKATKKAPKIAKEIPQKKPAAILKTTEAETTQPQVETEELSPVVIDKPMPEEDGAEEPAQISAKENPTDNATNPTDAISEKPQETTTASSTETGLNGKSKETASDADKIEQESEAAASVAGKSEPAQTQSSEGSGQLSGQRTGQPTGNNSGSGTGSGTGSGKIVEAAQLRPLNGNPLPQYPREDRLLRRQGTSVVLGDVSKDGSIANVRLEKSSGSKAMDSAALGAFKNWKFAPGSEATVRKAFQYALLGAEQVSYTGLKR